MKPQEQETQRRVLSVRFLEEGKRLHAEHEMEIPQEAVDQRIGAILQEVGEDVRELLNTTPVLYERNLHAPRSMELDPSIQNEFPRAFYENATRWLEKQPRISRASTAGDTAATIRSLLETPYDRSRVRIVTLKGKKIQVVSKRSSQEAEEEVARAKAAYAAGIPTPKVLGTVQHWGNRYDFFEHIESISLDEALHKLSGLTKYRNVIEMDTEEGLEEALDSLPGLEPAIQGRIRAVWENGRPALILRKILNIFLLENNPDNLRAKLQKQERYYSPELLTAAMQLIGYESMEALQRVFPSQQNFSELREFRTESSKFLIPLEQKAQDGIRQLTANLRTAALGVHPEKGMQELLEKTKTAGVEHQDFHERNILVPWNMQTNVPRTLTAGEHPLYVIDWEPLEPKPEQPESGSIH